MIIIRDKKFAFANLKAAASLIDAGKYGAAIKPGLKSVGTMAGYGLGATAVGAGALAAKKANDIVKDDVDY
jgi:hypothetical protein